MAFGNVIRSLDGVPIAQVYVPGVGFIALQGLTGGAADGSSNVSTSSAMTIGGPPATDPYFATVMAGGTLRVSEEPAQLFNEDFDTSSLDVTNKWKSPSSGGGGVAATNVLGSTSIGSGTTINGWSYLESAPTFPPNNPGWLMIQMDVNIESPVVINSYRFWGLGTSPATPTAALPLTNACGFEVGTAGKMVAVTFQSGTRVAIQDLSAATGNSKQPTDALPHLYGIYYRDDRIYWYIDTVDNTVASTTTITQGPDVNLLPLKFTSIANTVAPLSSCVLQLNSVFVADTSRNHIQLADGTFPWRQATIDALGNLWVATGLYNGATVDQQRGNINTGAIITAVGATTSQNSLDQTNYNGRGVAVTLNMTAVGTGSVTLSIVGKDSVGGNYYTLLSGVAVTTNVSNTYTVYPGITAAANVNANNVLPRTWRVQVVANLANAATYTVAACVIV